MTKKRIYERRQVQQIMLILFYMFIFGFLMTFKPALKFWNLKIQAVKAFDPTVSNTEGIVEQAGSGQVAVGSIEDKIRQVFKEHTWKAMLLLQGNGTDGACAENKTLNPTALNDNTKWGGVGKDWGVFQINDKWQGVSNTKFLKDPDINIRMAWRLYEDNGYSFKLWTCGKVYGI